MIMLCSFMPENIADAIGSSNSNCQFNVCYERGDIAVMEDDIKIKETRRQLFSDLVAKNKSKAAFAREYAMDATYVSQLLTGHRKIGEKTARVIEEKLGLPRYWLDGTLSLETTLPAPESDATIELATDENYAFVPLYDVRASTGNGHPVEHELIKGTLAFQREWLRSKGLAVKNLSVIYAMGKSMEPRINDGDVLLVDASQRDIKDGKVYAIRWHGELRIKRLVRDYDGSVRIISDNKSPDYPEQHVPADALSQLEIIGRVVWMGGDL